MSIKISVQVPTEHPHLSPTFGLLHPEHVRIVMPDGPGETPDVFAVAIADPSDMFNVARSTKLGQQLQEYTEKFGSSGTKLVIDGATEGWPFNPAMFDSLHRYLDELKIAPESAILISTNYVLERDYAAWCKEGKCPPITFFIYDFWCYRSGRALSQQLAQGAAPAPSLIDKKAVSLNRVFKAHRAAVALTLLQENELENNLVSFMPDSNAPSLEENDAMLSYLGMLGWSALDTVLPQWPKLASRIPLVVDAGAETVYLDFVFGSVFSPLYRRSAFAVITESDFGVASVDRVTEKPFKAIANRCPFLLVGQPYQLLRLQHLGFEPSPMFDDGYDMIEDANLRLQACLDELRRLISLPLRSLQLLHNAQLDVLDSNFDRLSWYGAAETMVKLADRLRATVLTGRRVF